MNEIIKVEEKQAKIVAALENKGVTLERMAEKINRGLDARKITVDKYGDEHEEDDHAAINAYLDKALKLRGLLQGDSGNAAMINIDARVSEEVLRMVRAAMDKPVAGK